MPFWTFVSTPSEIRFKYREKTPAVFRIHYKGTIRRLLGTDREGVLYTGAWAYLKRAFDDFIRSSTNGTKGDSAAGTLHYLRRISPGIAALFGEGSTAPHIELSYMLVPAKEAAGTWYKTLEGYIRPFGELPPLNGNFSLVRRPPLAAPAPGEWTFIDHPSELKVGKLPAVYRVHLRGRKLCRWLRDDPLCILEIGKGTNPRDRLNRLIKSAIDGRPRHTEGQRLHQFMETSPGFRALFKEGIPGCLYFSYRSVAEEDLIPEENLETDHYASSYGELPPLNGDVTGERKRIMKMMRELGPVKKRN